MLQVLPKKTDMSEKLNSYPTVLNQCALVKHSLFHMQKVISGVIQGSILGPCLFTICIDTLSCRLHNFSVASADDIKLIHGGTLVKFDTMLHDVNCVYNWSLEYEFTISLKESSDLHLGANNPCRGYILSVAISLFPL